MSCCNTGKKDRKACPACGQPCVPVSWQTMLHQVRFPDNQNIAENDYTFCANKDCAVGYFSASHMIPKTGLRAFQASPGAMLCYCFDISEAAYRSALADGSAQTIKAFVVQQTKDQRCACKSSNPSGRCCLAEFSKIEKNHDR